MLYTTIILYTPLKPSQFFADRVFFFCPSLRIVHKLMDSKSTSNCDYISQYRLLMQIPNLECINQSRVLVFAGKKSNSSPSAIVIVVPIVVSAVLIICIGACCFYLRVRKAEKKVESKSEIDLSFVVANDILDISTRTKKKRKKERMFRQFVVSDVPDSLSTTKHQCSN
jgi:hypothetical protein